MSAVAMTEEQRKRAAVLRELRLLRRALRPRADWEFDTRCEPDDAEALDAITGTRPTALELEQRGKAAQMLCATCPVRRECGATGDRYQEIGVWGGSLRYVNSYGRYVAIPLTFAAAPSPHEPRAERIDPEPCAADA